MNHIYKVVRCSSTGLFKAVSELGKSQGKGKGLTKKLMAVGVLAAMASTGAQAGDVLSGSDNTATGLDSVVAGGRNNNATVGADSVYIGASTVSGGNSNTAQSAGATVAGGVNNTAGQVNNNSNQIVDDGQYATVSGGENNNAEGNWSTISGGVNNVASGWSSVISGGSSNISSESFSTVSGGRRNNASGTFSSISGGDGNIASNRYATVSGGLNNEASGDSSVVGGGVLNRSSNKYATVSGGLNNKANGIASVVGGGGGGGWANGVFYDYGNTASGNGSVVGGGGYNPTFLLSEADNFGNTASGQNSVVDGGESNIASGEHSSVGGGSKNHAAVKGSTVGGGRVNTAGYVDADGKPILVNGREVGSYSIVAGGRNNKAEGDDSFVGGGVGNSIGFNASDAVIAGGVSNNITSTASNGFIGGGTENTVSASHGSVVAGEGNTASAMHSFIGGGQINTASGSHSVVGGGYQNINEGIGGVIAGGRENQILKIGGVIAGGTKNKVLGTHGSVGGGEGNIAGKENTYPNPASHDNGSRATVAGGWNNEATGASSFIGGGQFNKAVADTTTIGGGANNTAGNPIGSGDTSGAGATVGGGQSNSATGGGSVIAGGGGNRSSGYSSTVGGGYRNLASGKNSTVGGGTKNIAKGEGSFVAGIDNTASTDYGVAMGYNNKLGGTNSVLIGQNNNTTRNDIFILGSNTTSTQANSVLLGNNTTDRQASYIDGATIGGVRYSRFAGMGTAPYGVVSVGSVGGERQLVNVAAGALSATSTDAVNGSQVFEITEKQNIVINKNRTDIDKNTGDITNIQNSIEGVVVDVSAKADKTYVDDENAKQDTIINNNRDEFVSANNTTNERITTEVGRIDGELEGQGESITTNNQASIDRDDVQNTELERLEEVKANKTYVDDENDKQNTVINTKADTTYVDNQNNAQNTIITQNRTDIDKNTGDITNIQNSIEGVVVDVSAKADITYVDSENTAQNEVIASNNQDAIERNNATNVKVDSNTTAINKGFSVGNGNSSNKFDLGSTIEIAGDANTIVSTTDTGLKIGIASDVTLNSITLGTNTMTSEGLMVGGVSITNEKGINAGGKVISGVADAVNDDEAVNYGQIKAGLVGVAKNIKGDGNISVEANDEGETLVSLNKDIALDSVTVGANTLTANGLSIGGVSITNEGGINAGGQSIGGVGNGLIGLDSRDAINGGQMFSSVNSMVGLLGGNASQNGGNITMSNIGGTGFNTIDEAIKANKTAIEEVRNIVVNTPSPKDIVADSVVTDSVVSGSVVADSVVVGDVTIDDAGINAGGKPITNVGNGQNADDAVNLGQLEDAVANGNKGFIVTTQGENATTVANGGSLDMSNTDGNVVVSSNSSTNGVSFDLNKDIKVDSVTATTVTSDKLIAGQTTVSDKGISIGSGDKVVELTASGLNNGGNRISNISAGIEKGDAVNYGQLSGLEKRINGSMSELGYRINDVEDGANAGVSVAMASSALPQAFVPGKSMIGGGAATYNGQSAVAVGLSKVTNDGRFVFKISGSADTQGNAGGSVGAGFQF